MHLDRATHLRKSFLFGQSWLLLVSYFLTSHINKRSSLQLGPVIIRKKILFHWGWFPVYFWPCSHLSVRVTVRLLLTEAGLGTMGLWRQCICHSLTSARVSPVRGATGQPHSTSTAGLESMTHRETLQLEFEPVSPEKWHFMQWPCFIVAHSQHCTHCVLKVLLISILVSFMENLFGILLKQLRSGRYIVCWKKGSSHL